MNNSSPQPQYLLQDICKSYAGIVEEIHILRHVNLEILSGQSLAIVGASGSGKSTLLHLLGTLDTPTSGNLYFEGLDLPNLKQKEKAHFRNKHLGFIFQAHHLLPEFSTLENVAMQALVGGMSKSKALNLAKEALERVGLEERMQHQVNTLSGGERQRAAIARAILLSPKVLLADEPTGNLDEKTGQTVFDLLLNLNKNTGMTLIVVTHNLDLAKNLGHCLELRSGELYEKLLTHPHHP